MADGQRDGHPAEYRWHPLTKFRNSIPCTTPQSLADGRCWSVMQQDSSHGARRGTRPPREMLVPPADHKPKFKELECGQLECGPLPNVIAAQPNLDGALCESSVIPFLVHTTKFG